MEHAIVNLGGGNVLVMGGKADNGDFGVGVEDPRNPGNGYLGVLSLKDGSVVTSGITNAILQTQPGKGIIIF